MRIFFLILTVILVSSEPVFGISEVIVTDIERPHGAILFIVDGLGSTYFYPEFTPYGLDGSMLTRARTQNLTFGARILNARTQHPVTGIAHSVLVTGYSAANEEMVGFPDASLYDVTRKHGILNIAVMQKGDFSTMRGEQDIIMLAENNSIEEPMISIQANNPTGDIYEVMYQWKMKMPEYLNNTKGVERYSAYNKWGIDAAVALAEEMIHDHPSRRFLLTVNVGAIDSGGHYLGEDDYPRLIEDLDRDFFSLYQIASEHNIALILTADHGMAFSGKNAQRGGHSSPKYAAREESLRIPVVILSPNTVVGVVHGEYGQEDIAPTVLSILDLPARLQYADGKAINAKKYASLFVNTQGQFNVSLWNDGRKLAERSDSEVIFAGLPLNTPYTIKAVNPSGNHEEHIFLDSDRQYFFNGDEALFNKREIIAVILIFIVNVTGLIIITRIKS